MNHASSVRKSLKQLAIVLEAIGAALLLISLLTPWITVPGSTDLYFIIPSMITTQNPFGDSSTTFIAPLAVSAFQSTQTLTEAFMILLFAFGLIFEFAFVLIKSARDSAKSISLFAIGALLLIPLIYIFFWFPSISPNFLAIGFNAAFFGSVLVLLGAIPLFFSQRGSESTMRIAENHSPKRSQLPPPPPDLLPPPP